MANKAELLTVVENVAICESNAVKIAQRAPSMSYSDVARVTALAAAMWADKGCKGDFAAHAQKALKEQDNLRLAGAEAVALRNHIESYLEEKGV